MSYLENDFAFQLNALGIKFEREFKAIPGRQFRFDFFVQELNLLIEIQGGIWKPNRGHTNGRGISRDCEKFNQAQLAGFHILLFTPQGITSGEGSTLIETIYHTEEPLRWTGVEKK
ncbi:MAG: hypothetical protein ABSA51_07520 [Anaerolineaceae bacterium]|jgi:very-short-patch-repair endonuclease